MGIAAEVRAETENHLVTIDPAERVLRAAKARSGNPPDHAARAVFEKDVARSGSWEDERFFAAMNQRNRL